MNAASYHFSHILSLPTEEAWQAFLEATVEESSRVAPPSDPRADDASVPPGLRRLWELVSTRPGAYHHNRLLGPVWARSGTSTEVFRVEDEKIVFYEENQGLFECAVPAVGQPDSRVWAREWPRAQSPWFVADASFDDFVLKSLLFEYALGCAPANAHSVESASEGDRAKLGRRLTAPAFGDFMSGTAYECRFLIGDGAAAMIDRGDFVWIGAASRGVLDSTIASLGETGWEVDSEPSDATATIIVEQVRERVVIASVTMALVADGTSREWRARDGALHLRAGDVLRAPVFHDYESDETFTVEAVLVDTDGNVRGLLEGDPFASRGAPQGDQPYAPSKEDLDWFYEHVIRPKLEREP